MAAGHVFEIEPKKFREITQTKKITKNFVKLTNRLQGKLLVYSCQSIGEHFELDLPQVILVWHCPINAEMNNIFEFLTRFI